MNSKNALSKNYISKRNNILHKINNVFLEKGSGAKPIGLNPKTIFIGVIGFIILLFIILLISRIINYSNKKCDKKKSMLSYLFSISDSDPCSNSNSNNDNNNNNKNDNNNLNNMNQDDITNYQLNEEDINNSMNINENIYNNNRMKNTILRGLSKDDIRSEDMIIRPYSGKSVDRLRELDENEASLLKDPNADTSSKKEVFHIANQKYSYEQSRCKCAAYGAKLATKANLINAYNNGANWCTYGWSEDQTAYYPVQKCEWDKMMAENRRYNANEKNSKKYCGYPGINGGYFTNKDLRFGVNCYGIKPKNVMVRPKDTKCSLEDTCKLNINYDASRVLNTDEII
jgi:hypothetical protein